MPRACRSHRPRVRSPSRCAARTPRLPSDDRRRTGARGEPRYHSPLRARQAAATRLAIIHAAIRLFGDRGWAATTLPMVAAEAGTAVDTIYSAFGTKSGLLMAAIDLAIAGDGEPT